MTVKNKLKDWIYWGVVKEAASSVKNVNASLSSIITARRDDKMTPEGFLDNS
jgi:hypothetical protein